MSPLSSDPCNVLRHCSPASPTAADATSPLVRWKVIFGRVPSPGDYFNCDFLVRGGTGGIQDLAGDCCGCRLAMHTDGCEACSAHSISPNSCSTETTEQNKEMQEERLYPESWQQLHGCPVIRDSVRQHSKTALHSTDGSREGETFTVFLIAGQ